MELILVRHARPEAVVDSHTIADPGLSELGRWQAEQLCEWLAHEDIDHVVTSPKRRAQETVQPLVERLGVTTEVIVDLDEIDRYSKTYYPTELLADQGKEYYALIKAQAWDDLGWDPPDVFSARVLAAMEAIVIRRPGQRVVVATHGGVMNRWLAHLFGVTVAGVGFNVPYASVSRVLAHEDRDPQVISVNETGHFDARREAVRGPMRDGLGYRPSIG